jgi:hypothetical protein
MSWGFWLGIFVVIAIVIGASVLVGKMLSRPGGSEERPARHQQMLALKASGALRHRKSNQD